MKIIHGQTYEQWFSSLQDEFAKLGPEWEAYGRSASVGDSCWRDLYHEGMTPYEAVQAEVDAAGE